MPCIRQVGCFQEYTGTPIIESDTGTDVSGKKLFKSHLK
jgi:hypothetical protein